MKAPSAPDPAETAAAQGNVNRETAISQQMLNMVNQVNPWGNVNYEQTGETGYYDSNGKWIAIPKFTQTTNLSPSQQAIFDQTQAAQGNLAQIANNQSGFLKDYLSKQVDISGAPDLATVGGAGYNTSIGGDFQTSLGPGYQTNVDLATSYAGADDFSADRQRVEQALMDRMQPSLAQDEDRLRSQLIASGLRPGTPAYSAEMQRLSAQRTDARNAAIAAGGTEQSRLVQMAQEAAAFGNNALLQGANFGNQALTNQFNNQNAASLSQSQFQNAAQMDLANQQNAARQQYIAEQYAQRNQPLNEISALLSGAQVANPAQQSSATPTTSVAGVDYAGLVNQKYQSEMANYQSTMGGLFGLGGALGGALIMSDRRTKWRVRRVTKLRNGLNFYSFSYRGAKDKVFGFMADEVARVMPSAVYRRPDGLMMVDYAKAIGAA